MSTTLELAQAFEVKSPPDQIKIVAVRRFELSDPDDPDSPMLELLPQEDSATYCWRLDIADVSHWISQGNDAALLAILELATEDEDQGAVVGTLTKVELDGKIRRYGPVELRALPWQRLQSSRIVV